MKIRSVSTLNFDKLYNICASKINDEASIPQFGYNIYALYNNLELSFGITDVSPVEAYYLREYSWKSTPLMNIKFDYDNIGLSAGVRRFSMYEHEIMEDDSVTDRQKYEYPYNYGPAILLKGDMNISLSGHRLLSILSDDPSNFFLQSTSGRCASNFGNGSPLMFKKEFDLSSTRFTDFLAKEFSDYFKRHINTRLSNLDNNSDSGLYKYFISHDKGVKLVTIRHPYLEIDIRSENDNWKKDVEQYKTVMKSSASFDELNKNILDATEFEVSCCTPFSTFINLYMNLPTRLFSVIEDIRIPHTFREVYIPSTYAEKVASKLYSRYDVMNDAINTIQDAYDKICHTYLNANIAYNMKMTLNEINLYINQLAKTNKITADSKNVLMDIMKCSKTVYKLTSM